MPQICTQAACRLLTGYRCRTRRRRTTCTTTWTWPSNSTISSSLWESTRQRLSVRRHRTPLGRQSWSRPDTRLNITRWPLRTSFHLETHRPQRAGANCRSLRTTTMKGATSSRASRRRCFFFVDVKLLFFFLFFFSSFLSLFGFTRLNCAACDLGVDERTGLFWMTSYFDGRFDGLLSCLPKIVLWLFDSVFLLIFVLFLFFFFCFS